MVLSRRNLWLTAISIAALMVAFPPWLYFDGNTSNQRSAGYHFLLSRPPVKSYQEMFGSVSDDMSTEFVRVRLNVIRLITQFLTILFLVMGIDLKLTENSSAMSGCLLIHGICGILLLVLLMSSKF